MLTLNLLPSSSSVTITKSSHGHSSPPRLSEKKSYGALFKTRTNPKTVIEFQTNSIAAHITNPSFSSSKHNFLSGSNGCYNPFGFAPRPRSQIPDSSAAGVPQESSPPGDAEPPAQVLPNEKRLKLAIIFGLWYFQNIVFNIFNKKVLNIFPFPWLLASIQLFAGSVWMLTLWSLKLQPCPNISKSFILALLGPALFHTVGHISACVSFSKVAVSFTHVIKSSEPVFSVLFSTFLGDQYPISIWLSILPIVLGCSLAAVTEVSFNFQGLWGALISNVGFVLRNIYSKKSLQSFKEVDGLNLYGWITIISLMYLFPVAILVEGSQWVQGYHKAIETIGKPMTFYLWVLISGVFYHLYNQASYQALDEISPLTFSVGNTMKRVVVIVSSVLVFRNPVRPLNALGSAIAIFGTFLYSQANAALKAKKEKVQAAGNDGDKQS